jgi:CheY-like chemotaxis protein/CHASE3 domain sensor protein
MSYSFRTKVNSGFIPALILMIIIGAFSYQSIDVLTENSRQVLHTQKVLETGEEIISKAKDLETGERGYLLSGKESYLEPYTDALGSIGGATARLQQLTEENESQQKRVAELKSLIALKIKQLRDAIETRREKGLSESVKEMLTDSGKETMDQIRDVVDEIKNEDRRLLAIRNRKTDESTKTALSVIISGGILSLLILVGAMIVVNLAETDRLRANLKLEDQNRIRAGLIGLGEKMTGEQSLSVLARNIIETLVAFVGAQVGTLYLADDTGKLKWAGGYGIQFKEGGAPEFNPGDGLVGQAAASKKPILVAATPDHYLKVRSSVGDASPAALTVLPLLHDGEVKGVAEIGTFSTFSASDREYLESALPGIAVALNSAQIRAKVAELLEETQAQAEELQVQQEELKSANEELEEQSSALEEQASTLQQSNREIEIARTQVEEKAIEVERASRYKSEFLANMSHELRTPLNSILLLSRSLAENSEANLTEDQKEVCLTIHSSGKDLLSLISDILDLSKVEAGKLDIVPAPVDVADLGRSMENLFRAQMDEKGLKFTVEISETCPKTLFTDRLRVEQIVKNFLSNSLKFTQTGGVTLAFDRPGTGVDLDASGLSPEDAIAISVRDTGIGIPEEKKNRIFEAFEQIDGTSNRKYGGAGLGLTIARKLSGLLGGEIQIESTRGEGSRFVVFLPERLEKKAAEPEPARTPAVARSTSPSSAPRRAHGIEDDRAVISGRDKSILIIEDDPNFAKILLDYCRQRGFRCLLAADGETGLEDARKYRPSAILLDLKLPGMNGMTVLENLKGDAKTRHIPVHVISVDDRGSEVLKMGAMGFLAKPVSREGIETALQKIDDRLSSGSKKVLVIEDRKIERENVLKLVADGNVQAVGVETGAEALKLLRTQSFDCVILDLKLPDMSGFELLEVVEKDRSITLPPVIVYTGRDLLKDEIEQLTGFSESIIIKGARSEERLLDEVTLFLHRVEADLPKEKREMLERLRHREALFEGKKLLVVDDDMRNVFALRNIFLKKGFEIVVAKTGKEALEKLNEHPTLDLVLMDIMMPEMDGYEAMRRIRSDPRFQKLPIIALTAKATANDRENCLQAGANDYLSKPLDLDHLLSLLRVWLGR